jgi:hypothetical protein
MGLSKTGENQGEKALKSAPFNPETPPFGSVKRRLAEIC